MRALPLRHGSIRVRGVPSNEALFETNKGIQSSYGIRVVADGCSDIKFYASTVGDTTSGGNQSFELQSSGLSCDTWSHVGATYDGTQLRLFVNGTLQASQAATGSLVIDDFIDIGGWENTVNALPARWTKSASGIAR